MRTPTAGGLIYLKLVLTTLIWGATFPIGRYAAKAAAPLAVAEWRFALAAAALMALLARRERLLRPTGAAGRLALALGFTGVFAYNICFFFGLERVPASRAALIVALNPVLVALAATAVYGQRLSLVRWGGVAVSLFGAALVISRGELNELVSHVGAGELIVFGSSLAWSAYTLLGRNAAQHFSPLASTTWAALAGALMLLPPALWEGRMIATLTLGPAMWLALLHLGLLATVVAFLWYAEGVKAIGPTRTVVFTNLVPVFAVLIGVLLFGEELLWSMVIGGALVSLGVWLTNRPALR
ncbi:DMT family transporter [Crenobacter cavernae]|uniref:DMT family transporter n=1 Tax=Crenobacter cavernae TaxID=2290923 RepID=A0A345Y3P0_9NEIS|nr:DMT family transporter [Crenobacter cavernae]